MTRSRKRGRSGWFRSLALLGLVVLPAFPAGAFDWNLPVGFPTPRVPSDNPPSREKIALGRYLFYDTRLSGNLTQSCASCHRQPLAFTDGLANAVGSTGDIHPRGSMSLTNAGYASTLGWANDILLRLEQQALVPMFGENPVELGLAGLDEELLRRLRDDARYRRMFREAFSSDADPISLANLVRALTTFVRSMISGNAPYDRFVQAIDDEALSASAIRGGRLFFSERLECFHCHGGFNFALNTTFAGQAFDESAFQNNGLYDLDGRGAYPPNNLGLLERTNDPQDMGAFKAPSLRNIELTGPYMHDGSITTLEEVLDHYGAGGRLIEDGPYAGDGRKNPFKNNFVRGFELSAQERQDVLAFLKGLTDPDLMTNPSLADPFLSDTCACDCDWNGVVDVAELRQGVEVALGHASLGGCVAADRDGDGEIGVEELTGAVSRRQQGCDLAASPDSLRVGSTVPGAGQLALVGGLTPQVFLRRQSCEPDGECEMDTFTATQPGFAVQLARGDSPLYPLVDGAVLKLQIHTAIADGAALTIGETHLAALGDQATLGRSPSLVGPVTWSLRWPRARPLPRQVTLWFQLSAEGSSYEPSQPIAAVLLLENGEP